MLVLDANCTIKSECKNCFLSPEQFIWFYPGVVTDIGKPFFYTTEVKKTKKEEGKKQIRLFILRSSITVFGVFENSKNYLLKWNAPTKS